MKKPTPPFFRFWSGFNPWDKASLLLAVVVVGFILGTVHQYGMSWDEKFRYHGGQTKLAFYERIFFGEESYREVLRGVGTDRYPGLFDLSLALLDRISPFSLLLTGHLLSAFFGMMGLWGTWCIGRLLGGPALAFGSLLILVLLPNYYGHLFINPKDIPFAATAVWALYSILRLLPRLPALSWPDLLLTSLAIGLTMAVRVGGILYLLYLAIILCLWSVTALLADPKAWREWLRKNLILASKAVLVVFIAYLVMLAWWPYGQSQFIRSSVETVGAVTNFDWDAPVLFDGRLYSARHLPWFYLPFSLAVTTPLVTLLAFFPGLLVLYLALRAKLAFWQRPFAEWASPLLLLLAVLFPLGYVWKNNPTLYDGIRHFLFLLPALAVLAAWSWLGLWRLLAGWNRRVANGTILALGALLVVPTVGNYVLLHPYQYTYYNFLVGGLPGAKGRFETEYWGTSNREAVRWLDDYLQSSDSYSVEHPAVVGTLTAPWLVENFVTERMVFTEDPNEAEFIVTLPRVIRILRVVQPAFREQGLGSVHHEVQRRGATLAIIFDRRDFINRSETRRDEQIPSNLPGYSPQEEPGAPEG